MNPQIIAFFERVEEDPPLTTRVEAVAAGSKCAGDIVDIAADVGYAFTIEELLAYLEAVKTQAANVDQNAELNPEELDKVVGGAGSSILGSSLKFSPMRMSIASALTCCGECIEAHEAKATPAVVAA